MKLNKWLSFALALVMVLSMALTALADDTAFGKVDQQTYPLTKEKVTLTMWYPNAGSMGELADFNDGEFWQWLEEKTNVHMKPRTSSPPT